LKRRYKVIFNVEVTDPEQPFPAGGSYTHENRIEGITKRLAHEIWCRWPGLDFPRVTLDKIIDKGKVKTEQKESNQ